MHNTSTSLEQQLAQAISENQELKKALREIESSVAEAQAATKEMEHVIYALSHDFREPLRTISGYAQLLQRQFTLDDNAREMTDFIVNGANDMRVLIEDVLRYSRVNSSPERTTIGLGVVIACAVANMETQIHESGAQLTCGDLPELTINESQFVQLFRQLFTNALKFRSADPPKIEVTAEEKTDAYLVSVRDNGVGIESKYHETVFAPFKRLHGKDAPGTGLGLAICRKILRAHGGRIWVESDGQHGSAFRFTVPF